MADEILKHLVEDAELVSEVGLRLGRLRDPTFFSTLGKARVALASSAGDSDSTITAALQDATNTALKDLAPITLLDLRGGWTPFTGSGRLSAGASAFMVLSILLLLITGYVTQVYNRANSLYETTIELQNSGQGAEQAVRLFGLLKKNQSDVIDSIQSGKKDFLYDTFATSMAELELKEQRFHDYNTLATRTLDEVDFARRVCNFVGNPDWLSGVCSDYPDDSSTSQIASWIGDRTIGSYGPAQSKQAVCNSNSAQIVSEECKLLKQAVSESQNGGPTPTDPDLRKMDVTRLVGLHLQNLRNFTNSIHVSFDPLSPIDYTFFIYEFKERLSELGMWVLPGLYGMLGAAVFQLRRIMDAAVPNPRFSRVLFRVILGGFAGIIFVWFTSPATPRLAQPVFSSLGSFGLAFLFGFSTDIFFQGLDRVVTYASQAFGKPAA